MLGTATRFDRLVLVSRPKGEWGAKPLSAEPLARLAREVKALDATHGGSTTLRVFAPPRTSAPGLSLLTFPSARRLDGLDESECVEALPALWAGTAGRPVGPTLAVCTHGRRDPCCARWGQPLLTAARALTESGAWNVIETSHLGGHRFAATLLELRPGAPARMYGRLDAAEAGILLEHLDAGEVWLARYRGRTDLDPEGQLVEGAALAAGAKGPIVVESDAEGYLARWPGGALRPRVEMARFRGPKGCGEAEAEWTRPVLASSP